MTDFILLRLNRMRYFFHRINILLLFVFLYSGQNSMYAQEPEQQDDLTVIKGWNVTPAFLYGNIIRHTDKFQPTIDEHSRCLELSFSKQLHGNKMWEYSSHYPFLGFSFSANVLGNDSILGNAYALLPYIELPLVRGTRFNFTMRLGTGIAYLTKHYDEVENPTNNVIASHFNNITQAAFSVNWKMSNNFSLLLGNAFTHYSTGAVRLPNLGINIYAWRAAVRYTPRPYAKSDYLTYTLPPPPGKLFFNTQIGLGFQEQGAPHGPLYQVYSVDFSVVKILAHWNEISIGMLANYKESSRAFIKQQEIYDDQLFLKSSSISAYFRDDFVFGNIGIPISLGYFFYAPSPLQIRFFQKIGAYYSFPLTRYQPSKKISAGVYVTAAEFTADYVSVECGFRF